jgi:ankyrin repeat protein
MNDDWLEKEQLHFAADDGDLEQARKLVEGGCDVNAFDEALSLTPLHYAARNGHVDVIEYLLSVGADVNAHDKENIGETPLGDISANCTYEVAELLIKAGADPTIPGWMQLTALGRASERKKPEGRRVHKLLLDVAEKRFGFRS